MNQVWYLASGDHGCNDLADSWAKALKRLILSSRYEANELHTCTIGKCSILRRSSRAGDSSLKLLLLTYIAVHVISVLLAKEHTFEFSYT